MPPVRLRRLRRDKRLRDWVSEVQLAPHDFILPYFIVEGRKISYPIKSMPGVSRLSMDTLVMDLDKAVELGIRSILLFGITRFKDNSGSPAYRNNGVIQKAIREVKKNFKDIVVITDVCLCGYTSHGHCGIITKEQRAKSKEQSYVIDNDKTLKMLAKIALSHADSGADFVAPSAMMDGQVGAMRKALDIKGFKDVGILSYSAKYASNFYGPFREAFNSKPQFGDRKTYQMDFRNSDEALREIRLDIDEGADIVMVKPALCYLDIIYRAKRDFNIPIAAYNVSGEYAMVKAYCEVQGSRFKVQGIEKDLVLEILTCIKRAGADFIITYWAKDVAKWLK